MDSMQVFRGMDIGTAKPSADEQARVPHFMIDVVEPDHEYTVAEFQREGRAAMESTECLIAGGSGLHFRSLVDPLEFPASDPAIRADVDALAAEEAVEELLRADPDAGDHVDLANPRRVQRAVEIVRLGAGTPSERATSPSALAVVKYESRIPVTAIGVDPGERLGARIEARFDQMLAVGLLDEVEALTGRLGRNASQAVGYKELAPVVAGEIALEEGRQAALRATASLAKRQRTFFSRDPRIQWVEWSDDPDDRYAAARTLLEASWTS